MSIGPQGPLRKDDGPACRACGCTEHNACVTPCMIITGRKRRADLIACSWVKVEGASPPLCSACAGTASDLAEALARIRRMLNHHSLQGIPFTDKISAAALTRYRKRKKGLDAGANHLY